MGRPKKRDESYYHSTKVVKRPTCKTCEYGVAMEATIHCKLKDFTMSWMSCKGCAEWKMSD
jgi:RNase P subunit RPR2